MERRAIPNLYLSIVLLLAAFGLVMVYSSSSIAAQFDAKMGDPLFFVQRQGVFLVVGLIAMFVLSRVRYQLWLRFAWPVYAVAIASLIAVMLFGSTINNAKRWIMIGPIGFQASEFAKLAVVVAAAAFVTTNRERLLSFRRGMLMACAFIAPLSALIIIQPDLGTSLFVAVLGFIVLLAGGLRLRHVLIPMLVALPAMVAVMFLKFGHVQDRILVFMDPESDKLGKGHQIYQSLIAVGNGGLFGQGLGNSTQKLYFLPEEHTDFIFAVIVEELGFAGAAGLILLFLGLLYAGSRVAKHAPDRFGALLAMGLTASITLQAAMNMAVVTASVPTKGIALPFMSYGGTGLVLALCGVGIVLNVARQALDRKSALELRLAEAREDLDLFSATAIAAQRASSELAPASAALLTTPPVSNPFRAVPAASGLVASVPVEPSERTRSSIQRRVDEHNAPTASAGAPEPSSIEPTVTNKDTA